MPWEAREPSNAETPMTAPAGLHAPVWTRIGSSVRGKAIEATTIGTGPRRIYIIAGMQGDEPEGSRIAHQLPEAIAGVSGLGDATVRIVRDMNPDGTAAHTRTNTRGVDLARNWPSKDYRKDPKSGTRPGSELETSAVYDDLMKFKPDVVLALHASARGSEVTFEGPALAAGRAFVGAARQQDPKFRLVPTARTTLPGSLESLVGRDWNKPALVVEYYRGRDIDTSVKATRDGVLALAALPELAPKAASAAPLAKPTKPKQGPALASELGPK